jgi:DnaB-like helicase C terminal domain
MPPTRRGRMALDTTQTLDITKAIRRLRDVQCGPGIYYEPYKKIIPTIPPGTLMTIGGYVGSFKTTFGYNFAYTNAVHGGWNSLILSLEMPRDEIYARMTVRHALHPKFYSREEILFSELKTDTWSLNAERFYNDELVPDFQNPLETYQRSFPKGQVCVIDPDQLRQIQAGTVDELLGYILHRVDADMPGGLDILVIDYAQLLASSMPVRDFEDNFKNTKIIARYMKDLALAFTSRTWKRAQGLTVVLLSQLSRAAYQSAHESIYKGKKKGPERYKNIYNVTAFAESTEIERASDICITLYSDDSLKNGGGAKVIAQLLKNRQGERNEEGSEMLALPDRCYIGDLNVLSVDPYLSHLLDQEAIEDAMWTINR